MNSNPTIEKPQTPFYAAGFPSLVGLRLAAFPLFKMNKSACQASNYRSRKFQKSFKPSKTSIESGFSHNFPSLYPTRTHFERMYILSEVNRQAKGNLFKPSKGGFLAYFSHPRSHSHTPSHSLFLSSNVIDAKNGSFASTSLPEKDVFYDPPRKPAYLENPQGSALEVGRLSYIHSRRGTQRRKAVRSHLCDFQVLGPNPQDQGAPVRMARAVLKTQSPKSRKVAAFVFSPSTKKEAFMECKRCGETVEVPDITVNLCTLCWIDAQQKKEASNG